MTLLRTENLEKHFGGLHVTAGVNLALEPGEIHCLIGPNGAGKSTLFRLILGEYAPSAGRILYDGQDITALPSYARIRRGISVKFQVPGIFPALGVRQNLQIALQDHLEGIRSPSRSTGCWIFSICARTPRSAPAASATARNNGWKSAWRLP
jgi:branched-chain amino acid transport system ATP-binding protein